MSFKDVLVIVVAFVAGFLAVNAWMGRDTRNRQTDTRDSGDRDETEV